MRSLIAPPLIAALLFTGCGPLLPRTTIVPPATTGAEREVAFRDAARKMLGKRVTVQMLSGDTLSGTLRAAGETSLAMYQPETRTDTRANTPAAFDTRKNCRPFLCVDPIHKTTSKCRDWVFIGAAALLAIWPVLVYGGYPD